MGNVTCCYGCVPPKRTPTCHATCPEYAEQQAANAEKREAEAAKRAIAQGLYEQRGKNVRRAERHRRR